MPPSRRAWVTPPRPRHATRGRRLRRPRRSGTANGPRPSFRAVTENVTVDVVVLDRDGAPVEGLTAADFKVTVGGTPRTVANAAYVSYQGESGAQTPAPSAEPPAGAAAGSPAAPPVEGAASSTDAVELYATNQGAAFPRLLVFAIDESHVRPMAAKPLLQTARRHARRAGTARPRGRRPAAASHAGHRLHHRPRRREGRAGADDRSRATVQDAWVRADARRRRRVSPWHRTGAAGGARHPVPEPRVVQDRRRRSAEFGPAVHGRDLERSPRHRRRFHDDREGCGLRVRATDGDAGEVARPQARGALLGGPVRRRRHEVPVTGGSARGAGAGHRDGDQAGERLSRRVSRRPLDRERPDGVAAGSRPGSVRRGDRRHPRQGDRLGQGGVRAHHPRDVGLLHGGVHTRARGSRRQATFGQGAASNDRASPSAPGASS